jgi:hypothetical protein
MYPIELHKTPREEGITIAAFIQLMDIRFKDDPAYQVWKKSVLPVVKKYAVDVLNIQQPTAQEIRQAFEPKSKFTFDSLDEVLQFISNKSNVKT